MYILYMGVAYPELVALMKKAMLMMILMIRIFFFCFSWEFTA